MNDGSVWCFRDADGEGIMRAHIWMSSCEGTPDALIFSNKHENEEDLKQDIRRTGERYNIHCIIERSKH